MFWNVHVWLSAGCRVISYDRRGFGIPQYQFLAFPAEEPPSIECNEDAGQELIDN
jgi:hypothetical protein